MQKLVRRISLAILFLSAASDAQMQLKADQFGRPLLVNDFWVGGWEKVVTVYTDPHQVLFIGDPGFDYGFSQYEDTGKYTAYLWTYYPDDYYCRTTRIPAGHEKDPKWRAACKAAVYRVRQVNVDTTGKRAMVISDIMMGKDAVPFNGAIFQDKGLKQWFPMSTDDAFSIALHRVTSMLPQRH